MKKVLIVTHGNLPLPNIKGGAVEKLVQYIIDYNEERADFDLTVLSCHDENAQCTSETYRKVKFVYLHNSFPKWRWYVNRLFYKILKFSILKTEYIDNVQKYLRKHKESYDIVIFENNPQFILHKMPKVKATKIFHIHNDWFSDNQMSNVFYRRRMISGAKCYNCFFCVSPFIKSNVDKYVRAEKNIVVNNGVDSLVDNSKKDEIITNLCEKLQIEADNFVFMYSGRLVREKGVLELLQAFSLTTNKKFKLIVVGGADYSSNSKTEYVNQLEEFAIHDNRIVFTGYVDAKQMPYYNIISNVVVVPTYWVEEAGALSAIEAIQENNVLIVSDSGHLKWWGEQDCSLLIQRNEDFVSNLSKAINLIGSDSKLYEAKKSAAAELSTMYTSIAYYNQFKQNLSI